ncbi:MAG: hypothetical protein WD097_03950 [Balneolales bacterium]
MKNHHFFLTAIVLFTGMILMGCNNDNSSYNYPQAEITHSGFDFSAEKADTTNWENNDGEIILWMPGGNEHPQYPNFEEHVWFRTNHNVEVNETKDMGDVDLASIKSVPDQWDQNPDIPPLLPGNVIVARCKDGYVKFKVLSVNPDGAGWPAEVEYYFSAATTFDN